MVQLDLDRARRPDGRHGGWRPGAGRKKRSTRCAHTTRAPFAGRHPLHVTLRLVPGVRSLRRDRVLEVVRTAIEAGGHRVDFRVVHFNVLGNHLHLIVEAAGPSALARGMQGLTVRFARRINRRLDRSGKLFAERYHARVLRSPREVRDAIRYVLLNARHHAAERGERLARRWIDPFSSAPWFDGWREAVTYDPPWLRDLRRRRCPTAPPASWLLREGWRRHGLLGFDEVPGELSHRG